ncbi:thioredoxin family protein [Dendrosporobacter sp. 1207_IL3150]|uniref:thioredoxin family protein n=1 Tax=Dendrosporobacter sp. 1207_IL3150 TaxID=3084054 RepID=UPI002FD93B18
MIDEKASNDRKNIKLKFVIPLLLICLIFGIWAVKNKKRDNTLIGSYNADFALHVTEELDIEKLKQYGVPIIIDFGADSCIPCQEMAPVLKELNEELQGKAIIKFVDVWKYQKLANGYPVRLIPTQVLIDSNGKPFTPKKNIDMQIKIYKQRGNDEHVFTTHEGGLTKEEMVTVLKEMGLK